jgi:UDP-glucose 4-epimerase
MIDLAKTEETILDIKFIWKIDMKILITGGAGYIGSHTCVELLEAGHDVFVIDNLSNGNISVFDRIRNITGCEIGFMKSDIRDSDKLDEVFSSFAPDAVIHFAGLKAVGESVSNPLLYYDVNVSGSVALLNAMTRNRCHNIIFSSSATVYGDPLYLPYDEMHPTNPVSPYGRSKLMIEKIIHDWTKANSKRKGSILRYFNPVGAHTSGQIGEAPNGTPNNLMPYIAQVAIGRRDFLNIFGSDYETEDGTPARDYIHVVDLAKAHLKTLENKSKLKSFEVLNLGYGAAITVLEVIKSFERASGTSIDYKFAPNRQGDVAIFWADASHASKTINWKPKYTLNNMCEDAWRWQTNNIIGYD